MPNPLVRPARGPAPLALAFLLLLLSLHAGPLAAQSPAPASLSGRVTHAQLGNAYVEGAEVRLVEANRVTTSNREGGFSIPRVAPGRYTLQVSYLGLETVRTEVQLAPGETRFETVSLRSAVFALEGIVVAGQIEGQAQALNLQRYADNLKTVVSQDALGQIQEGNIGDALNRLPGLTVETRAGVQRTATIRGLAPQYNTVTVDGFTMTNVDGDRDIALDSYPSNTLAYVEVVRAVTPDMPGDAIGGSVNLITRTAFDQAGRTLFGNLGTTYNAKRGTYNRQVELTAGDRFGRDGRLGALLSLSSFQDVRGYDVSNIGYAVNAQDQYSIVNNLVYDRDEKKEKVGVGLNLDFRPGEGTRLFAKGMYNYDYRWLHRRATDYRPAANQVNIINFYREPKNIFQMYVVGASHERGPWELDFRAAYSKADKDYPATYQVTQGFNGVALAVDRSNPAFPVFSVTNGVSLDDVSRLVTRNIQVTQAPRGEDDLAFESTVRRQFLMGSLPASLKGGLRYSTKDAAQAQDDYARYTVTGLDMASTVERYSNDRFFSESGGRARLTTLFPSRQAWERALASRSGFTRVEPFSTQGRANSDWSIGEDIFSSFLMTTVDVGELRILAGARVERTANSSRANEVVTGRVDGLERVTDINQRESSNSYTNWLPGLHLRYNATPSVVIRASANRTISRPPPGDLIPSLQVNAQLTQPAVVIGNPDLVPATSTNLDLSAEYYLPPLGLLSAGVFRKEVDNFVFSERTRLNAGPFAGFDEIRRVNGEGGKITGLELAWSQQLTMLPGFLSGLGLQGNATFLSTEGAYPGREDEKLPLTRSPEWIGNVAVGYTAARFSARGSFMARSDRLIGVGGRPALDRYAESDRTLDFSTEYALPRYGTIFFHTRNLLNRADIEFQGTPGNPVSTTFYGRQFNAGLKYEF